MRCETTFGRVRLNERGAVSQFAGGQIAPARLLHWYSHLRDGDRSICAPADRADKVGIPVVGVTRLQIRRRNPEMVYITPPSSLVCVVAP